MDGNTRGYCLERTLCDSTNQVVTICTESCCFTGLLICVSHNTVKMVTRKNNCPGCNYYGNITIIPICEIVAVTLCNTSM